MLFWAPSARLGFSVSYGINLGVLTIVVALSPTLGQSLFTFVLQIGGQGLGYIYGCM